MTKEEHNNLVETSKELDDFLEEISTAEFNYGK